METPWATAAIVALCAILFFGIVLLDGVPEGAAFDPSNVQLHQLFTGTFFHVSAGHLIGNMIFLVIFGRYVEARLGPLKFVALYLLSGLGCDLVWFAVSDQPAVGASGAICGVIGFVLAVAPHNRLNMVFTFGGRWDFERSFQIAVGWMIGLWIFWDLYGIATGEGGVAFAAHLGGYATGFGIGYGLSRPELEGTHWYVEPPPKPGDRTQTKRLHAARGTRGKGAAAPERGGGEPEPLRTRGMPKPSPHVYGDDIEPLREECPHQVILRALGPETSPVGVIKLLMKHKGMAPEKAKVLVDAVAGGDEQVVAFETVDQATRFADDGRRLEVALNLRTAQARP